MQIFEIGIVLNGLSILHKQYESKFQTDKDLRDSLMDAILKMAEYVLSQKVQSFNFGIYKLIILSRKLGINNEILAGMDPKSMSIKADLTIYGIGDLDLKSDYIQTQLERICVKFLNIYPNLGEQPIGDITKYKSFLPTFDEILEDLKDSPEERFSGIF